MSNYQNELEQFIYEICLSPIWESAASYINEHPYALDLSRSRIKYPTGAYLENVFLEFPCNINIIGDVLFFDAVMNCSISLIEESEQGYGNCDLNQWLTIACEAKITDRLEYVHVTSVRPYLGGQRKRAPSKFSPNIVPIIKKEDLEAEAEAFLSEYYPEALVTPCCVPIADIAKNMGLSVIQGKCITDDFSIFGEICFSAGQVQVYDLFKTHQHSIDVKRGTILIDAFTFWERNLGCVNNTIAHEVYHWHKHRMYAAIKHILRKENFIACRCPSYVRYPNESSPWTDEQWMEWQANNLAPRILMPLATFKMKVNELYQKYGYASTGIPANEMILDVVSTELASFYAVSKQSVLLRMQEAGYSEAMVIYRYVPTSREHFCIEEEDAFFSYSTNTALRELVDSRLFVYVQKHFVINDSLYIARTVDGRMELTTEALENLADCSLSFYWVEVSNLEQPHLPGVLMHRANAAQHVSVFTVQENEDTINLSEELRKKRKEFEQQNNAYRLSTPQKNGWQLMGEILEQRKINKSHFCDLTGLDEIVYRRAISGAETRPSIETIVAFACGLDLDMATTQKIMQLSSHAFDESTKHRAYMFCITGFSGRPLKERNDFLESYGFEPLGSKQRL